MRSSILEWTAKYALFTYCAVTQQLPHTPQCLARTQGNKLTWRSSLQFSNPEIQGSKKHSSCMVHQKNTPVHLVQLTGRTNRCIVLPPSEPGAPTEVWRFKSYYERNEYHRHLHYKEIVHRPPEIDKYKEIVHRPLIVNDTVTAEDVTHSQFKGRLNFWVCLCTLQWDNFAFGLKEEENHLPSR